MLCTAFLSGKVDFRNNFIILSVRTKKLNIWATYIDL